MKCPKCGKKGYHKNYYQNELDIFNKCINKTKIIIELVDRFIIRGKNYDYDIDTPLSVLSSRNEHIESCMDSLPKSIVSFLEGNSFIEVIRNAVSLGGDTYTIGAIAGAMAESYYGIPQEYDYIYLNKLDDDMLETIINFKHFINN